MMVGFRGRPNVGLLLSDDERRYLERQVRRHRAPRSLSDRCRIILRCADGLTSKQVGAELGFHEHTVGKWRRRFQADRLEGLVDDPRPFCLHHLHRRFGPTQAEADAGSAAKAEDASFKQRLNAFLWLLIGCYAEI